jgi:multidrug efflux pump subunit AcrA (membrane-fusion protein)
MFRKYGLPLGALALLSFAVLHVVRAQAPPPQVEPTVAPWRAPFAQSVAGTGVVEARTQNIAVGSALSGVVQEVPVEVGQQVRAGTLLFRLEGRALKAELKTRLAGLESARAQLARLENLPRPEELPPAEARLREAQANRALQQRLLAITRTLYVRRAASQEELTQRQQAEEQAAEQVARARGELDLLRAGASAHEKAVSRAAVEQASTAGQE